MVERSGQRLLLALTSSKDEADNSVDKISLVAMMVAVGGVMCLVYAVVMCTCKDSKGKKEHEDTELQQSSKKADKKSTVQQVTQDNADTKLKTDVEIVVNGGTTQSSNTMPGHSRQASSGSAHMRPTSLRELPAPPVSNQNKTISGVEQPSTSTKCGPAGGAAAGSGDYGFHQHAIHSRNGKNSTPGSMSASIEKGKPVSDGYDHLGPKLIEKPADYDSLAEPESTDGETPMSENSLGLDGHYSLLRERTYAVVVDVKAKAKELFDPYSKVKDKEDSTSDYYSQVKEEDPYNQISDSSRNVSSSFISQLRQSRDLHDTYATVQEGTRSELKSVQESRGASRGTLHSTNSSSSWKTNTASSSQNDVDGEEEYAVVQKSKGASEQSTESDRLLYSEGDISLYSMGPPEPPRLYNDYDSAEDASTSTGTSGYREHKYSKVTARESLASMSARNALNPYEMVMDIPENTYATVEGGSGDGVVFRGGSTNNTAEKRLSQTSDTYAEIGISGGGLSSSIISSSSSAGGNNNNNSSSSVAPVPPSLDSLHLMTKSQTSSEGDRLSDRHLASPEDSSMSLNIWGDSQDDNCEDGYSTLKKQDNTAHNSNLPALLESRLVTDEDSGEVTLVPNYQTVKDCISDNEAIEESENDPNYESVDEARAKVALLKARNSSLLESRTSQFNSLAGASGHTNAKVINNATGPNVDSLVIKDELPKSVQRRRRLDHDYEEVDITPPSSPTSTPSSINHSSSSSFHVTSFASTTSNATTSSKTTNEASLSTAEARESVIQSHMYEELSEVRAKTKTLEIQKMNKGSNVSKSVSDDKRKSGSNDKKKEEKVKNSSDDKRKNASKDKRKNASEEKRKNGEDKKKISHDEKRKSTSEDKKKVGLPVANGTRL